MVIMESVIVVMVKMGEVVVVILEVISVVLVEIVDVVIIVMVKVVEVLVRGRLFWWRDIGSDGDCGGGDCSDCAASGCWDDKSSK
jgi:hypothetical protein